VCEGEKTEPNYFLSFRVTNDVYGAGKETIRVVEEARRLNDSEGPFDQIWCVFDRDSFPAANFDNAIHMLEALMDKGFRAAYSNEAFELWYILHFVYLDAAISRDQYAGMLEGHLGRKYRKGDTEIYALLRDRGSEALAIERAVRLCALHAPDQPPSQCSPVTTVYKLVQKLRQIQAEWEANNGS
jgi:hypothetical protein